MSTSDRCQCGAKISILTAQVFGGRYVCSDCHRELTSAIVPAGLDFHHSQGVEVAEILMTDIPDQTRGACHRPSCLNEARYTTVMGTRSCALDCMAVPAIRDIDIPALLVAADALCTELEKQLCSVGTIDRLKLRQLIGAYTRK